MHLISQLKIEQTWLDYASCLQTNYEYFPYQTFELNTF